MERMTRLEGNRIAVTVRQTQRDTWSRRGVDKDIKPRKTKTNKMAERTRRRRKHTLFNIR